MTCLETADLDGLWPEGAAGRVLVTTTKSAVVSGRRGTQVIPIGFYSVREALNCLTERLSANPVQRQGAIDLIEALGREPLALGQASSVVANSTLACRDYRDYFARRRQQIGAAGGRGAFGGRGHLDAVPGPGRVAAAGRLGAAYAGISRAT